jgi:hypothetical protein
MTIEKCIANRYLIVSLVGALGVAFMACGGSDDDGNPPARDAGGGTTGGGTTGGGTTGGGTTGGGMTGGATCNEQVYSELSPGCKTCVCAKDEMAAPACQGPCWDFLACSFKMRATKCKTSYDGGDATRAAFEMCTLTECGTYLSVPGAQAITGYREITKECTDGDTLPCRADVTKFGAALK